MMSDKKDIKKVEHVTICLSEGFQMKTMQGEPKKKLNPKLAASIIASAPKVKDK